MATTTDRDLEIARDVLEEAGAGIGYWARARWQGDALVVTEEEPDDDGDRVWYLRPHDVLAWLASDGPAALIRQMGDPYQKAAVASLVAHDWDEVDYDRDTADMIVQQMVLSEVRYG